MNKLLIAYQAALVVFAFYLSYCGYVWFSVFVICLSFICYAMLINETSKSKNNV